MTAAIGFGSDTAARRARRTQGLRARGGGGGSRCALLGHVLCDGRGLSSGIPSARVRRGSTARRKGRFMKPYGREGVGVAADGKGFVQEQRSKK